jgi:opacity protein-like surface antigen
MQRKHLVLLGVIGVILATLAVPPAMASGSANFTVGKTKLDQDVEPADDQDGYGLQLSFGKEGWPVMLAVDLILSSGDGSESYSYYGYAGTLDADVKTTELAVGVRKEWGKKSMHPFLGGGLQWTNTDAKVDISITGLGSANFIDDSDSSVSFWANAGIYWRLGKSFNLGVNVRYRDAEATFREEFTGSEVEVDTSGVHYGVLLGWGW